MRTSKMRTVAEQMKMLRRAKHIGRTLGTYQAARYLCKRGVSVELAAVTLATRTKGEQQD